jgi:hypothetical protein
MKLPRQAANTQNDFTPTVQSLPAYPHLSTPLCWPPAQMPRRCSQAVERGCVTMWNAHRTMFRTPMSRPSNAFGGSCPTSNFIGPRPWEESKVLPVAVTVAVYSICTSSPTLGTFWPSPGSICSMVSLPGLTMFCSHSGNRVPDMSPCAMKSPPMSIHTPSTVRTSEASGLRSGVPNFSCRELCLPDLRAEERLVDWGAGALPSERGLFTLVGLRRFFAGEDILGRAGGRG